MFEQRTRQVGRLQGGTAVRPDLAATGFEADDRLAASLVGVRHALSLPLARAARSFHAQKGWVHFGHARLSDHARERFGRSGRWVRDLAALGHALERHSCLERALCGADDGPPLGRVAAGLVGRCATDASVEAWIALARRVTVRELREHVVAALGAREVSITERDRPAEPREEAFPARGEVGTSPGETLEVSEHIRSGADVPLEDVEDLQTIVLRMPREIRAAFGEAHELSSALEGHATDVASFVEALVAEACSGGALDPIPLDEMPSAAEKIPDDEKFSEVVTRGPVGLAGLERRLAEATDRWRSLASRDTEPSGSEAAFARSVGHRARFIVRYAGEGSVEEVDEQIRTLVALENELERALGRVLSRMSERRAWTVLRFSGTGHYGEQRLGMSRSAAESRAWLARAAARMSTLGESYEEGGLGHEAALVLARLFSWRRCTPEEQAVWVAHAEGITLRRLRDEVSARLRAVEEVGAPTGVLSDAEWRRSLERRPGDARDRVGALCDAALAREIASRDVRETRTSVDCESPDVLQERTIDDREAPDLRRERTSEPWGEAPQECARPGDGVGDTGPDVFHRSSSALVSLRLRLPRDLASELLRVIDARRGDLPEWAGLASLLLEFVETWDRSPRRASDQVFMRDGWRCTAPCCSSRRNLEDHHIRYRSRGGGKGLHNRTCLCRFHHQMGEHGGLMKCTGSAPLGMTWRMGRAGSGGRFRNDRAI